MTHRLRPREQDDLHRLRLVDLIDLCHEPVTLARLINRGFFEQEWSGLFPSSTGQPAAWPQLVAGLLYRRHAFRLSKEAVVACWVENS